MKWLPADGLVDPAAEDFPTGKGATASEEEEEDEEGEDNTDIGASGMTAGSRPSGGSTMIELLATPSILITLLPGSSQKPL